MADDSRRALLGPKGPREDREEPTGFGDGDGDERRAFHFQGHGANLAFGYQRQGENTAYGFMADLGGFKVGFAGVGGPGQGGGFAMEQTETGIKAKGPGFSFQHEKGEFGSVTKFHMDWGTPKGKGAGQGGTEQREALEPKPVELGKGFKMQQTDTGFEVKGKGFAAEHSKSGFGQSTSMHLDWSRVAGKGGGVNQALSALSGAFAKSGGGGQDGMGGVNQALSSLSKLFGGGGGGGGGEQGGGGTPKLSASVGQGQASLNIGGLSLSAGKGGVSLGMAGKK